VTNEQLAILLHSYGQQLETSIAKLRDEIRRLDKESGDVLPKQWMFTDGLDPISGNPTGTQDDPNVLLGLNALQKSMAEHINLLSGEMQREHERKMMGMSRSRRQ
jgi:hypothetical protein